MTSGQDVHEPTGEAGGRPLTREEAEIYVRQAEMTVAGLGEELRRLTAGAAPDLTGPDAVDPEEEARLGRTLLLAQEAADQMSAEAERRAAEVLASADARVAQITSDAERRVRDSLADARRLLDEEEATGSAASADARAAILAALDAVARRLRGRGSGAPAAGDLRIDSERQSVCVAGQEVALAAPDLAVLETLLAGAGTTVNRATLVAEAWGEPPATGALDACIRRLRSRLSAAGIRVAITTVRGVGYRLDP